MDILTEYRGAVASAAKEGKLKTSELNDVTRRFTDVLGDPLKVPEGEDAVDAFRLITSMILLKPFEKASKITVEEALSYISAEKASQGVADSTLAFANIPKGGLGTHTDKVPNPKTGNGTMFMQHGLAALPGWMVCGATTKSDIQYAGAKDSKFNRATLLMCRPYVFSGVVRCGIDDVLDESGLWSVLKEADEGLALLLASEIRKAMDGPWFSQVFAGSKVLIVPVEDAADLSPLDENGSRYLQVTPVHSFRLAGEMKARRAVVREEKGWLYTDYYTVGGSKPQNAGFMNLALGGQHHLLRGYPPPNRSMSRVSRLAYAVQKTGSLLRLPDRRSVETLGLFMSDRFASNIDTRGKIERQIEKIVGSICWGLGDWDAVKATGHPLGALDKAQQDVASIGWNLVDVGTRENIVTQVHSLIVSVAKFNFESSESRRRTAQGVERFFVQSGGDVSEESE